MYHFLHFHLGIVGCNPVLRLSPGSPVKSKTSGFVYGFDNESVRIWAPSDDQSKILYSFPFSTLNFSEVQKYGIAKFPLTSSAYLCYLVSTKCHYFTNSNHVIALTNDATLASKCFVLIFTVCSIRSPYIFSPHERLRRTIKDNKNAKHVTT